MKKITLTLLAVLLSLALLLPPAAAAGSYEGHLLMELMNLGTCKALTGTVELAVVLVSLPDAPWDSEAIARMDRTLQEAADTLVQEAAAYRAQLSIVPRIHHAQAETTAAIRNDRSWAYEILSRTETLQDCGSSYYLDRPVLFCLNTDGRSFAQAEYTDTQAEYAVVFANATAARVRHELLHLYGARDYYTLHDFAEAAETYCPDSIMLDTGANRRTDSLTAYLIGWTDAPDAQACAFLSATANVTSKAYSQALQSSIVTGWGTRESSQGVYTGMLSDGLKHGWGKMQWHEGSSYAGMWSWGVMNGQGIYTWPSGVVYSGDFADGQRTGKGVITWADGSSYAGDFVNGSFHGMGVMTWADGSFYIGGYQNNTYHGTGIYQSADGTILDGEWDNGTLVR